MGNQRSSSFDSSMPPSGGAGGNTNAGGTNSIRSSANGYASFDSSLTKRKRLNSKDSIDSHDYGWFEDFESPSMQKVLSTDLPQQQQPLQRALTLPTPVTEVPMYVLESSLETQQLWYSTAGRRPRQPTREREYFEHLWSQNFADSEVQYSQDGDNSNSSDSKADRPLPVATDGSNIEILYRGKASFSYSVNKAFPESHIATMTIQLPYYRICRSQSGSIYAEFLVVVSIGGRGAVTFGIWKRYSDFVKLAKTVTEINLRVGSDMFKNALLSWQCVQQRKRWVKSLDKEYLSVKCFLIGRFMADLLFESPNPTLISQFLGLQN